MRVAVLTVSDGVAAGARDDVSGQVLDDGAARRRARRRVARRRRRTSARRSPASFDRLCDDDVADLVLSTGGTGFAPRDVTPEATLEVLERLSPGVDQALRADALERFPHGMLSRGVSGTRGARFVVNLPGQPEGLRRGARGAGARCWITRCRCCAPSRASIPTEARG